MLFCSTSDKKEERGVTVYCIPHPTTRRGVQFGSLVSAVLVHPATKNTKEKRQQHKENRKGRCCSRQRRSTTLSIRWAWYQHERETGGRKRDRERWCAKQRGTTLAWHHDLVARCVGLSSLSSKRGVVLSASSFFASF
jgi:hypothetical protein